MGVLSVLPALAGPSGFSIASADPPGAIFSDSFERDARPALSASRLEVSEEQPVTISWTVENFLPGRSFCVAAGDERFVSAFEDNPTAGEIRLQLFVASEFFIDCLNDFDSITVDIRTFSTPDGFVPPPPFCGPEPAGRATLFDIEKGFVTNPPDGLSKRNFREVWGLWPGAGPATIKVPRFGYVAIPFYPNLAPGSIWGLSWNRGFNSGMGAQVSLSRCPGDFSLLGTNDPDCQVSGRVEGGNLIAVVAEDSQCLILGDSGPYYLNIRHADSFGANTCDSASCRFYGRPRRLN